MVWLPSLTQWWGVSVCLLFSVYLRGISSPRVTVVGVLRSDHRYGHRRAVFVAALAGAVLATAGCNSDSDASVDPADAREVRQVFDRLAAAANAQDEAAYTALICDDVRKVYAEAANSPLSGFPRTKVLGVEAPVIEGPDSASLFATTTWADGSPHRSRYVFAREHDQWKYCPDAVFTRRS